MTVDDVRGMVAAVKAHADEGDDPRAHVAEDAVRDAVLRAIAAGAPDPAALAAEALATAGVPFARWYE